MPNGPGVRTARKLLVGIGIGLAFISLCSVAALISPLPAQRHRPSPGLRIRCRVRRPSRALPRISTSTRTLEASSPTSGGPRDTSLARKAAEIERDLKAYDVTITQDDDRRQFIELVGLWFRYRDLQREACRAGRNCALTGQEIWEKIDALLTTMIEWNRLEGVRSIETANARDSSGLGDRVLHAPRGAALVRPGVPLQPDRRAADERAGRDTARSVALGNLDVRATVDGPLEVATVAREFNAMLDAGPGRCRGARAQRRARGVASAVATPGRRPAAGQRRRTDHHCARDSRRARPDAHRAQDGCRMDQPPAGR